MATLRENLKAFLNADTSLIALLTGGVLDTTELPEGASSINDVPNDGLKIIPFAMLRWRSTSEKEIPGVTERRSVEIYLYQHRGYATIERAKRRIKTVLNRKQLPSDDADIAMFHWGGHDLDEFPANELGGTSACMTRFFVDYVVQDES